ncbi:hypothetical protein BRADI_3g33800v3 [Brachypodium distachyon]|uniref:Pentatricopeptide repeat-containing protein n=1 Tax=Brachypodium distachyon TaxID=15368 RepID=I1I6A8_BRADI|nr:hypothetical protein BRADI_3g33800v3 [Brachypodium distachyon]
MPHRDLTSYNAAVLPLAGGGEMLEGVELYSKMPMRNTLTWNALMDGYVRYGEAAEASSIFQHFVKDGAPPDQITFSRHMGSRSTEAIGFFVQMVWEKVGPDANTFLLLLTHCCNCSLVD